MCLLRQDSAAKPPSMAKNAGAVLGQDLDSLLGSAASASAAAAAAAAPPASAPPPAQNGDLDDLNLDDLLGPGAAPPQRYSGGGTTGGARAPSSPSGQGQGWGSPGPQGGQQQRMSYSGEFGAASGQYGDTAAAAASKVLKGDQMVSLVEVGDEGACPVEEKDVDPKTLAALKARGIENFTPVQVGAPAVVLRRTSIYEIPNVNKSESSFSALPNLLYCAKQPRISNM